MNLIVDTSVWSHFLRRRHFDASNPYVQALSAHARDSDNLLIVGVILQEVLSGVRSARDFDWVLQVLSRAPLVPLARGTYVPAARLKNHCQTKGVQIATVDCLVAATCIEWGYPILTADRDFLHIARHCELIVLPPLA